MNISLTLATIALVGLLPTSGNVAAESSPANPSKAAATETETTMPGAGQATTGNGVVSDAIAPQSGTNSAETPPDLPAVPPVSASTIPLPNIDSSLPDTASLVARTGFSLLAVVFLIWGAVQILKKISPGGASSSKDSHIRVLDRAHIAPKKSIYVIQIGDKALAVGITDQQMTPLTDLDLEDTLARYAETTTVPVTQRFSDVMRTVNARLSRRTEEPAT